MRASGQDKGEGDHSASILTQKFLALAWNVVSEFRRFTQLLRFHRGKRGHECERERGNREYFVHVHTLFTV